MQFVSKTIPKPYNIEFISVPCEFEVLKGGNISVVEIHKKKMFLSKTEALVAVKAIEEKIRFFEYEISEAYIFKIKEDIKQLRLLRDSYKKAISEEV